MTTYEIQGMTCGGCVRSVTKALAAAGIDAEVSLDTNTARVTAAHDHAAARQAIEDAGFDVVGEADDDA